MIPLFRSFTHVPCLHSCSPQEIFALWSSLSNRADEWIDYRNQRGERRVLRESLLAGTFWSGELPHHAGSTFNVASSNEPRPNFTFVSAADLLSRIDAAQQRTSVQRVESAEFASQQSEPLSELTYWADTGIWNDTGIWWGEAVNIVQFPPEACPGT